MSSFIAKIVGALRFREVVRLAARKSFEDANSALDDLYAYLNEERPSRNITPSYNIMSALIYSRIGNSKLSCLSSEIFLWQMNDMCSKYRKKYSTENSQYLQYYCKGVLEYSAGSLKSLRAYEISSAIETRFSDIDFSKVKKLYKLDFPITKPVQSEILIQPKR